MDTVSTERHQLSAIAAQKNNGATRAAPERTNSKIECNVRTCRSEPKLGLVTVAKAILRVASNYLVGGGDFCIATSSPLGVTAFTDACLICAAFDACSSGIESTGLPACFASCLARVFG